MGARPVVWKTVVLLLGSNVFMTFAWYGQLRLRIFEGKPLPLVIVMSWAIALFEYSLMVPANRIGYLGGLSGYQLKIIQEAVTLTVFVGFAWLVLGERLTWNYAVSLLFVLLAVFFAFAFRASPGS